jgi:hypothetical protein
MWEGSEALRSDPLEEVDVRDVDDSLRNTGAQLMHAPPSQEVGRFLHESDLVAATTATAAPRRSLHTEGSARAER